MVDSSVLIECRVPDWVSLGIYCSRRDLPADSVAGVWSLDFTLSNLRILVLVT